jgi:hypothetical protein
MILHCGTITVYNTNIVYHILMFALRRKKSIHTSADLEYRKVILNYSLLAWKPNLLLSYLIIIHLNCLICHQKKKSKIIKKNFTQHYSITTLFLI